MSSNMHYIYKKDKKLKYIWNTYSDGEESLWSDCLEK